MEIELTAEEEKAISALKRVAKRWPKSLWLFSASGTLCVMKLGEDGHHAYTKIGGIDHDYIVGIVRGIDNDGGDW